MIDWASYRAAYDGMTYAEVAAFHRDVWAVHPDQDHYSRDHLTAFLSSGAASVLEVGGWRGEAAARTLALNPDIERWDNYEICEPAVWASVPTDPRYRAVFPDRWPWELTLDAPHDTAVLAHVIEHMRAAQLTELVGWLAANRVSRVYVEAPLHEQARSWRRSTTAHLLDIGWAGVIDLFVKAGFALREHDAYPPDRHVLIFGASA